MNPGDERPYPDYADTTATGHTRTRLPENDPYGGAPRRPTRSSSRSLVTVVGVVVLLIAAIAQANNLILVTHNVREFSRVVGLRIEDWEGTIVPWLTGQNPRADGKWHITHAIEIDGLKPVESVSSSG